MLYFRKFWITYTKGESVVNLQDPKRMALIRVWDAAVRGMRKYVESQGFVQVHNAPELVGVSGACENVDTLFKVDFFGRKGYLAQSDQLYLEMITPFIPKVWAEIQSFRAEPDADNRHLAQFSLFELEFQGNLEDLIKHISGCVKGAFVEVYKTCDLSLFDVASHQAEARLDSFITDYLPFYQISYDNAVNYLKQRGFPELQWGDDLKSNHELALAAEFGPMFITHYPLHIKFFNMRQNEQDPRLVNSTDLILPFSGESAGAAERETNYDTIVSRLKTSSMYQRLIDLGGDDKDFEWYLEAHKNKDIKLHSGTGIGVARVVQWILKLKDIREAVPFLINSENLL